MPAALIQGASKAVSKLKWPFQCRWNGQARPAAPLRSSQRAPKIEVLLVRRPHGWEPNVRVHAGFPLFSMFVTPASFNRNGMAEERADSLAPQTVGFANSKDFT